MTRSLSNKSALILLVSQLYCNVAAGGGHGIRRNKEPLVNQEVGVSHVGASAAKQSAGYYLKTLHAWQSHTIVCLAPQVGWPIWPGSLMLQRRWSEV